MKKNYRGWKLVFTGVIYTATKKGFVPLGATDQVGIERLIDAREFVEWRNEGIAIIKRANAYIRKLNQLYGKNPETN
jgi:hypothetical protein